MPRWPRCSADNLVLMRLNSLADAAFAKAAFSFVPPSLIERSVTFRQGEALIAGKISAQPALLRFAGAGHRGGRGRRARHLGGRQPRYRWLKPPDSSFDMGTVTGCLPKWAMVSRKSSRSREARSWLTPRRTRIRCTGMSDAVPVRV